ncbi:hypothetical protein GRJ2_001407900 [Grus japonensis]|uniref:Uncharacterized protein n=1 Tax=Grus japonensis TaxID=30415 RepID=A0ABC9WW56_GRUJA
MPADQHEDLYSKTVLEVQLKSCLSHVICITWRLRYPCRIPLRQPSCHLQVSSAVIVQGPDPILLPVKPSPFDDDLSLTATAYQGG